MEMKIGKHLAMLRSRYHYTQDYLAEKIGVSSNAVSAWETDQTLPSLEHMLALAGIYKISLDELIRPITSNKENTFNQRFAPFRFICTTTLGYYPETYVDYVEDLKNEMFNAWIWQDYYPYKRCIYALPVKSVCIDDFMSFVQDHAEDYFEILFEDLKELVSKEELDANYAVICAIASAEELADTPYDMNSLDEKDSSH